jgi:hypothetical protein
MEFENEVELLEIPTFSKIPLPGESKYNKLNYEEKKNSR